MDPRDILCKSAKFAGGFLLGMWLISASGCGGWAWSSANNILGVHFSLLRLLSQLLWCPWVEKAQGCSYTHVLLAPGLARLSLFYTTSSSYLHEAEGMPLCCHRTRLLVCLHCWAKTTLLGTDHGNSSSFLHLGLRLAFGDHLSGVLAPTLQQNSSSLLPNC